MELIKEGQVCPKCKLGTMRRFNSSNWGQSVNTNTSEFRCSNCGNDQGNARLQDSVGVSDSVEIRSIPIPTDTSDDKIHN